MEAMTIQDLDPKVGDVLVCVVADTDLFTEGEGYIVVRSPCGALGVLLDESRLIETTSSTFIIKEDEWVPQVGDIVRYKTARKKFSTETEEVEITQVGTKWGSENLYGKRIGSDGTDCFDKTGWFRPEDVELVRRPNDLLKDAVEEINTEAKEDGDIRGILNQRQNTHGDFSDHASIVTKLKAVVSEGPSYDDMTPEEKEATDMILHKIGRAVSGNPHFKDHWDDIAGYAMLVSDRLEAA